MNWIHAVSYFLGGAFLANAVPHFVSGMMGRSFQSPFAKPPGKGLSSSTVVGYLLVWRVGSFDLRSATHAVILGLGVLFIGLISARGFGRFNGGNSPEDMQGSR